MINADLASAQDSTRLKVEATYGNLPLSFEPNHGQTDPQVKFLSRASHRTLWLTNNEAVLAVGRRSGISRAGGKQEITRKLGNIAPAILRMKFVGANADPRITGEDRQAGTVNYFTGKPEQWRTKIPTYARVRYRSLYPGIDLVFYGNNRELEYDLAVSPGANPRQIKLGIAGAESLRLDADGNLVMKTAAGDVVQQKPRIYQSKGTRLVAVVGGYVINSQDEVGFRLGNYDHTAAMIIDPVLRYSSFLSGGGDEDDAGTGIAVDSSNRAVVAGWTDSSPFPSKEGSQPPFVGGSAAFVIKLDFTGSNVIFTAFIANAVEFANVALVLDGADNIYLAGTTNGTTFDPAGFATTPGAFQRNFGGESDAWVAKFDSTGTKLIYATLLGGSGQDIVSSIDVDSAGNAYVTGFTKSKNFPVTSGVFQGQCKLKSDGSCASAFVTKLNALGTKALFSSYLGGHGTQSGQGIAVNPSGDAFVTGQTDAKDFPTTAGTMQPVLAGSADAFVVEFSSSGSHLNFSTFLGGGGADIGNGVALDSAGNVFVTGQSQSTNFPIKNAFQPHCTGGCSFAVKLSPGLRLLYSTFIGQGDGTAIAATSGGQAYVTGIAGTSFSTTQNAFQRVPFPSTDDSGFITKLTSTGQLSYSSRYGGALFPKSPRVALDRDANAYLTGIVGFAPTIPVTPGAFQEQAGAELDGFVAKVVALCALSPVNRSVTICSPSNSSTVKSPVNIVAGTTDVTPVKLTQVYLDGKKIYENPLSAINVNLPIAGGTHRLTVQGLDTASVFFKSTISINVSPH
jgi:hypothetical protein